MSFGALAFLNPWLLAGLATLPLIYWLLKTVPPRPKQVEFPATRILVGLENEEKTPAKTPWWLLLIRLLAAALVILALAEPVLNPTRDRALTGTGPVVLVIDNGWAAASGWTRRTGLAEQIIADYDVKCPSPDARIRLLSGGNMQKLILGRALDPEPSVILANQPTRGLDVGAVGYVHRKLLEARARGAAILLISEDLEEIMALSDRIFVMSRGKLSAPSARGERTVAQLGELMAGHGMEAA